MKFGDIKAEDIVAPSLIEVKQNYIKLGERMAKSFFVFSYPRYLSTGWLSPLVNLDSPMDISLYIHPADSGAVLKRLRKKLTEVQAEIIELEEKGIVRDPSLETAYQDIEQLRDELQTARERIFQLGVYITIYGDNEKQLKDIEVILRSLLESRMIYLKPALLKEKQGFISTCPYGLDQIMVHTPMNTAPLSSIFPFVSPDLSANEGILYGINQHNNSLVLFDRFTLENANMVIFAKSGSGKSIRAQSPVLVNEGRGKIRLRKIGDLIDAIIKRQGIDFRDKELEGKTLPGIQVWTFDENMKGKWGEVKIAARKIAPDVFYKFKTKSGREITTTSDHNLVVLQDGRLNLLKGSEVEEGDFIPLPRVVSMDGQSKNHFINVLSLLKDNQFVYVKGVSKIILENYECLKQSKIDERLDKYIYRYKSNNVIPVRYFWKVKEILGLNLEQEIKNLTLVSCKNRGGIPALVPISEELTRVLGYILSEGTITDKFITISNTDSELLIDLEKCLGNLGILHFRTPKSINIASRVFVELMKALGLNKSSGEKRIPSFIFNLNREKIGQFLAAYFEGDGGVETKRVTVSATSKSKRLVSEISYLLYYFGIIARIKKTEKEAVGRNWEKKKAYWRLNITGQDNLRKFAESINFISQRKKQQLAEIIGKNGNTNVDIVPDVAPIFRKIYDLFGCQLHNIQDISNLKREHYSPSPEKLREIVAIVEERIQKFKDLAPAYKILSELPSLAEVIDLGRSSKVFNKELWRVLGQSWRVVKNEGIRPRFANFNKMLQVVQVVPEKNYELAVIKKSIYSGFQEMDLEMKSYDRDLQSALVSCPEGNTRYDIIQQAARYVWQNYQDVLINKVPQVEEKLSQLKALANADLFWDPIISSEKIENKTDKYVYDLTCENGVFLAGNGGMFVHNSYFTKVEILRYLMQGVECIVIDPENEYEYLSEAVGGSFFKISLNSPNHLNPFDLPRPREDEKPQDVLRSNVINLVGLLRIMLGGLTPQEDAIIDQALTETYAAKDITPESDPLTWEGKIPLMSDFEEVLSGMEGAGSLIERVRKFTKGSYANFFNQPSNINMENKFVVFGIRDMEDELRPMAMFVILRFIWNQVRSSLRKRILLVDEAWWIMQTADGASFLFGICKRARKYWLGVTTVTQDVSDFMRSDYGKPIISNSSLQFLMKQSSATIDVVQKTFNLTDGEKNMLLGCDVGEGVFVAGQKRVALKVLASYTEDQIITSAPEEVVKIKEAKRQLKQQ